jgi:asparagine synthase (glutamine-hydrolysing)
MCGIAGFISSHPVLSSEQLARMGDTLHHRGPDDGDCRVWNADGDACDGEPGQIGLAHRRLSILDLSAAGRQPMRTEDGAVWVCYNGEFYNHLDYRPDLAARHPFRSTSDTETLLYLYKEMGIDRTLKAVNGMFALAVWDVRSGCMTLARDRLGKKPLYYTLLPDGTLLFASEIKALLASGHIDRTQLDKTALAQFWLYGYSMGEQTIYRQIKRLLPGHLAEWTPQGFQTRRYWDCPFGQEVDEHRALDDRADQLEDLLCSAIQDRLISDVPLGLFLSGGIDSAVLAALARRKMGLDLESYTIGFQEDSYDESAQARALASELDMKNRVLPLGDISTDSWAGIAAHFDEPFGDSSAIPTYYVSQLAREQVTVVLTGDGGDELFGGYNLYRKALSLWGSTKQRKTFSSGSVSPMQALSDLWFRYGLKSQKLQVFDMVLSPRMLSKVIPAGMMADLRMEEVMQFRSDLEQRVHSSDLLSQLQYMNLKTYLVDDVLVKVDRMSMAHGLECRSPLLDYRVVEFAARQPLSSKISDQGEQKALLRHLLRRYVPEHLVTPGKRGFSTPWEHWCSGGFEARLRAEFNDLTPQVVAPDAGEVLLGRGVADKTKKWNAFSITQFVKGLS